MGYVTKKTSPVILDDTSKAGDGEAIDQESDRDATGGLAIWGRTQDTGTKRADYF